jgi:PAS domain S-box-containing protein
MHPFRRGKNARAPRIARATAVNCGLAPQAGVDAMKRAREPITRRTKKRGAVASPASNDSLHYEHMRKVHELEVHQIELELQNRALREAQATLEDSSARYAELYNYAPVGHITLDDEGKIKELNLASAALLGMNRRSVVNRPLRVLVEVGSRAALDRHLRDVFWVKHPVRVELELAGGDGDSTAVELVSVPSPPAASAAYGSARVFHSTMTDISQRKREERGREELFEREHEARLVAETMNRIKRDFLAVVSHELRSPLAPMAMWVRALRAGGMNETLRARAIDAIETCLNLEVAMIDDLIDVAVGQRSALTVELRPMELRSVVAATIEATAPAAAAKQIEIAVDFDGAPAWVHGDPKRLQQVVANLLTNAIAFTPEAGHIVITLAERGPEVLLAVRDDGEGIDPARLASIFEPLHLRSDGRPRHHIGLGLGLAIVRQLVGQHGGRVSADSPGPGRGSCFTVTLPRLETAPEASPS